MTDARARTASAIRVGNAKERERENEEERTKQTIDAQADATTKLGPLPKQVLFSAKLGLMYNLGFFFFFVFMRMIGTIIFSLFATDFLDFLTYQTL